MPWLRLQGLESPLSSLLFCRAGIPHRLSGFQGRGGERYRLPWLHPAASCVSEGLSERDGEHLGSDGLALHAALQGWPLLCSTLARSGRREGWGLRHLTEGLLGKSY